jgi:hypothetical protein
MRFEGIALILNCCLLKFGMSQVKLQKGVHFIVNSDKHEQFSQTVQIRLYFTFAVWYRWGEECSDMCEGNRNGNTLTVN